MLTAKLKKLKTALFSEQRTAEMAKKRDEELAAKLKSLTGAEDGDSEFVRQILASEIASLGERATSRESQEDIETEQAFRIELTQELTIAEQSIAAFEKYRKETLEALNGELMQCEKKGYLEMLREELHALQTELASL
jgi:hypothetical protein